MSHSLESLKFRLVAFLAAIAAMVTLIAATAQSAWRRGGELRERLNAVQLKSFQIADHFQQTILELNNGVLRYGVYHAANNLTPFDRLSQEFDRWIEDRRPDVAN